MTTVLNAYSIAYPTIENRIRAYVSTQLDPLAIVASITDSEVGHPARNWHFPGLERTNYIFELWEIDGSDNKIFRLAYFDVVPGQIDGLLVRSHEQIKVGETPGLDINATGFTFDGSSTAGGTLDIPLQGTSPTIPYIWRFTLSGEPVTGDKVLVVLDTDLNDIDGIEHFEYESEVEDGWNIEDILADLKDKISTDNPNVFDYTDTEGNLGLRVNGFSSSSGLVTLDVEVGSTKPDWRGWDINIAEISGTNFLIWLNGKEYTWDSVTGTFAFTEEGMVFAENQHYDVQFEIKTAPTGGMPAFNDFAIRTITTDENLLASDFGKKIIAKPAGDYIKLTLPDGATVVQGRRMMVEVDGAKFGTCVEIAPQAGQTIKYGKSTSVFICGYESFSIYKYTIDAEEGTFEFRVCDADGNFLTAGESCYDDSEASDVFNKIPYDGRTCSVFGFARLYNDVVLQLPEDQLVDFDSWAAGNNKYKFSRANSANPANANKFKIPERRGTFDKASSVGIVAGTFNTSKVGAHEHYIFRYVSGNGGVTPVPNSDQVARSSKDNGQTNGYIFAFDIVTGGKANIGKTALVGLPDDKTEPENVVSNKYLKC